MCKLKGCSLLNYKNRDKHKRKNSINEIYIYIGYWKGKLMLSRIITAVIGPKDKNK